MMKNKINNTTKLLIGMHIMFLLICAVFLGISLSALSANKTATGRITFALTDSPELSLNINYASGADNYTYLGTTQGAQISNATDVLRINIKEKSSLKIQIQFSNNTIKIKDGLSITTKNGVSITNVSNANGVALFQAGNEVAVGDYLILDKLLSSMYPETEVSNQTYVVTITSQAGSAVPATATLSGIYSYAVARYNVSFTKNADYGTLSSNGISVPYGSTYSASGDTLTFKDKNNVIIATIKATPNASTAQYKYAFIGWSSTSGTITADTIITANFTQTENVYTLTFTLDSTLVFVRYADSQEAVVSGDSIPVGTRIEYKVTSSMLRVYKENGDEVEGEHVSGAICGGGAIFAFTMPECNAYISYSPIAPYCCVYEDTLITLADGATKRADEIEVGDNILSYNFETGEIEIDTITRTLKMERKELVTINFKDGTSIKVTIDHPLFAESGWKCYDKEAGELSYGKDFGITELNIGDKLFSISKYFDKEVVSVEYEENQNGIYNTYQFGTEKNKNYFANEVLSSAFAD